VESPQFYTNALSADTFDSTVNWDSKACEKGSNRLSLREGLGASLNISGKWLKN
tara:strand:+ start:327 stop:488 length:162 start_codon:yes stop_codon:yes gene_type:complete